MDQKDVIPGRRIEIDGVGEGTIVAAEEDGNVEIAVSELETVRVRPEQLRELQ